MVVDSVVTATTGAEKTRGGRDSDDSRKPAYSILSASIISIYVLKR